MGVVYTRDDWNDIIQQVNDLAVNPDEGCDPVATLPEVDPDHIWTKDDITQVRDKLTEICSDNTFSAELRLWAQEIIDEINDAIAQGWCDCEVCELCEFGYEQSWNLLFAIPCRGDWLDPNYPYCSGYCHRMNWAPSINGIPVGSTGYNNRYWMVCRYNIYTGERAWSDPFPDGTSGLISCEGNIVATMDTSGRLGMGLAEPEGYQLEVWVGCGGCDHPELGWILGQIKANCE